MINFGHKALIANPLDHQSQPCLICGRACEVYVRNMDEYGLLTMRTGAVDPLHPVWRWRHRIVRAQ